MNWIAKQQTLSSFWVIITNNKSGILLEVSSAFNFDKLGLDCDRTFLAIMGCMADYAPNYYLCLIYEN